MIYSGHLLLSGYQNMLSCTKKGTHIEFWWGKNRDSSNLTSKDGGTTELTVRNKGGWTWFRIV